MRHATTHSFHPPTRTRSTVRPHAPVALGFGSTRTNQTVATQRRTTQCAPRTSIAAHARNDPDATTDAQMIAHPGQVVQQQQQPQPQPQQQQQQQRAGAHAARFPPQQHEDDRIHQFVHSLTRALKRRAGDREFATLSAASNAAVQSEGLYGAQLASDGASSSAPMDRNYAGGEESDDDAAQPRRQTAAGGPLNHRHPEEQLATMGERLTACAARALEQRGSHAPASRRRDRREEIDDATAQARLRATARGLRCGSTDRWTSECPQRR